MPPSFNRVQGADLAVSPQKQAAALSGWRTAVYCSIYATFAYIAGYRQHHLVSSLGLGSLQATPLGNFLVRYTGYSLGLYAIFTALQALAAYLTLWVRVRSQAGKPAAKAGAPAASKAPATPQRSAMSPLGQPLRNMKPIRSPRTPETELRTGQPAGGLARSPGQLGSRLSGQREPTVTTPEQLQPYLDSFSTAVSPLGASTAAPYGVYGNPSLGFGAAPSQASPLGYGSSPGTAPSPVLAGGQIPIYRPSSQLRGKTGSPHKGDGSLSASSEETFDALLARLKTGRRNMEVWTEQFRLWLAAELLQPLDKLVRRAQKDVVDSAAAIGGHGLQLSPLDIDLTANGTSGSKAASKAGAAKVDGAPEADEAVLLSQLRQRLVQGLGQMQQQQQQPLQQQLLTCLKAVNTYQQLATLLRGEQPKGLLLPAPRGYVASRVRTLAGGAVVHEFQWAGGGQWAGKPWSAELPTDTALLLFLFSAFLAAPKWEFPIQDIPSQQSGASDGALYLGSLPSRPPAAYTAILPFRPNSMPKGANAVLGFGLGSREPHLTLVLDGEPVLTLTHQHAFFHSVLLLLQNAQLNGGGLIGNRSLAYLGLSRVLKPGRPLHSLFSAKWYDSIAALIDWTVLAIERRTLTASRHHTNTPCGQVYPFLTERRSGSEQPEVDQVYWLRAPAQAAAGRSLSRPADCRDPGPSQAAESAAPQALCAAAATSGASDAGAVGPSQGAESSSAPPAEAPSGAPPGPPADPPRPMDEAQRALRILVAGGVAGAVSRTATAPVDRMKLLLQVDSTARGLTMREGWNRMVTEGTTSAFFRGNGTNVIKIAPETAIKLSCNDRIKHMVCEDIDDITPGQRMLSGALAGAIAQFAIYPLELVRTRLAVCPMGTYRGIWDCWGQIVRKEGWSCFYRGLTPSLIGILPYAGVDIMTFELLKEYLLERYDGMPPPWAILGAGMTSSSIAQFASYPLALVRTRMQAQGWGGSPVMYKGMWDVLAKAVEKEGVKGLYKGILPNLAKVAPAAGISWFVFEEAKRMMGMDPHS
ncbi:g671 [Coccomyxa viridis]|uniref:G671 protein n=1 Tax=Coccomyxa viridis TaxID=1274662 RepID=A0ABP1FK03_9CHLO